MTRNIRRTLRYSEEEWRKVAAACDAWGVSFSRYARAMTLHGSLRVSQRRNPRDVLTVRAALGSIGNNINQIARKANAADDATWDQLQETRRLMKQAVTVLEQWAAGGPAGPESAANEAAPTGQIAAGGGDLDWLGDFDDPVTDWA